jgi:hypothetical protein
VQSNVAVGGKLWAAKGVTTRNLPLYECNLILDTSGSVRDNVTEILATMGDADLVWSGGVYKLQLQYPTTEAEIITAGPVIDDDSIVRDSMTYTYPSASERRNFCTIQFRNEAKDFANDTASWPPKFSTLHTTYLAEDGGIPLEISESASGITDMYHALAKAEEMVRSSRTGTMYEFKVYIDGIAYEPGDIIPVNSVIANITNEYLKIKEIKFNSDNTASIKAKKFDYTTLAWNAKDNEAVPSRNNYQFGASSPSGVTYTNDGLLYGYTSGTVRWSAPADGQSVKEYIVLAGSSAIYDGSNNVIFNEIGRTSKTNLQIPGLATGSYVFKVVAVTVNDRMSDSANSIIYTLSKPDPTSDNDATPPPTPSITSITPLINGNEIVWTMPTYGMGHGHDYAKIYVVATGGTSKIISQATVVGRAYGDRFTHIGVGATGVAYAYWVSFVSKDNHEGPAAGGINGIERTASQVTTTDLANGAINQTKIANNLELVQNWSGGTLPTSFTGSNLYWTVNSKLYRWDSTSNSYITGVPGTDISGTIDATKLADGTLPASKFASGIEPVQNWSGVALPTAKQATVIYWTVDAQLYRWNASTSAYTREVPAASITGTIPGSQITASTLDATKFASSIEPVSLWSGLALPTSKSTNLIFWTYDRKQYRWDTTSGTYINTVDGNDIAANSITAGQIATGAITVDELASNSVTAVKIQSGTITGDRIQGGTITGNLIHGNTISADKLVANSITAGQIMGGTITADELAVGAITTDKLYVSGRGKALNGDPSCGDISAFYNPYGVMTVISDTSIPYGTTAINCYQSTEMRTLMFPVSPSKRYKVSLWARKPVAGGVAYFRMHCYTATDFTNPVTYIVRDIVDNSQFEGKVVPSGWTKYTGYIDTTSNSVYAQILLVCNYNVAGGATTDVTDVRCEEYIGGDLIVDGAITASKISANTITGDKLVIGTVSSTELGSNSVTSVKIQNGAVTAGKIFANAVIAGTIAAGAITTRELQAGSITTDKLLVTGGGPNLCADPGFFDYDAWAVGYWGVRPDQGYIYDGISGNTTMQSRFAGDSSAYFVRAIPVVIGRTYRVSVYARRDTGANGTLYYRLELSNDEYGTFTDTSVGIEARTTTTSWVKYSAVWVATHAFIKPMLLLNYGGNAGYIEAQDIRVEEMVGNDLIVDGSITANKITAGTITGTEIQGGSINGDKITAGTLNADRIQAGTINTDRLVLGAVTNNTAISSVVISIFSPVSTTETYTGCSLTKTVNGSSVFCDLVGFLNLRAPSSGFTAGQYTLHGAVWLQFGTSVSSPPSSSPISGGPGNCRLDFYLPMYLKTSQYVQIPLHIHNFVLGSSYTGDVKLWAGVSYVEICDLDLSPLFTRIAPTNVGLTGTISMIEMRV